MRKFLLVVAAAFVMAASSAAALADDWNVVRLRGVVSELIDGQWQPLQRGSVVPDTRVVKTSNNGHATLTRGNETIELAPNTQIQIYDQGGRKPFTTVVQHFGTVAIEAEVRNVKHFAVKNQYLAAVVKGTRFVVTAGRSGASVEVQRGQVSVEATAGESAMIVAGQKAKVEKNGSMTVSGKGAAPAATKKGSKADAAVSAATEALAKARARGDETAIKAAEKAAKDAAKQADKAAKSEEKAPDKVTKAVETSVDKTADVVDKSVDDVTAVVETTVSTATDVVENTVETATIVVETATTVVEETVDTTVDVVDKTTRTVEKTVDTTTKTLGKLLK